MGFDDTGLGAAMHESAQDARAMTLERRVLELERKIDVLTSLVQQSLPAGSYIIPSLPR